MKMKTILEFMSVLVLALLSGRSRRAAAELLAGPPTRVDSASTSAADFGPGTSHDHLELYFNYCVAFNQDCDLRLATRHSIGEPFGNASPLGPSVNSSANEFYPTVSPDGLELIFTDAIFAPFDNNQRRPGGLGGGDLWRATRRETNEPFGNVENLGDVVNTSWLESYPSLAADGLSLYFSSTRAGGEGGGDLYITTRTSLGEPFGPPVNLGPTINTPSNEGRATVLPSGLALVFDSNRSGGAGDLDLWLAQRASLGDPWEPAENLALLNTTTLESGAHFSTDGSVLYFESFRSPNLGFGSDLWQVAINPLFGQAPLPGDYNNNGLVEQADLDLVLLNWGHEGIDIPLEWMVQRPVEGIVDQAELDGVLLNWGNTAMALQSAGAVPEPSSVLLGVMGLIAGLAAHGRRQWRASYL